MTGERAIEITEKGLPSTYVPGRNLVFLTYAAAVSDRRDLKALERLLPFRPCDRAGAERVEVVGQQHGRGLGEPEQRPSTGDVLERHDEDPRRRSGGSRARHCPRLCGEPGSHQRQRETDGDGPPRHSASTDADPNASGLAIDTFNTHVVSPAARQVTISVLALMSKSASSRVNAAR